MQNFSTSSTKAIVDTLRKGARCLELDVFANSKHEPVVAHGIVHKTFGNILLTNSIMFEDAIKIIAEHAFEGTSDPLFICIENNTNNDMVASNKMTSILKQYFGDRLTFPTNDLMFKTLKSLLGTVTIFSHNVQGEFADVVSTNMWTDAFDNQDHSFSVDKVIPNKLMRIYPKGTLNGMLSRNFDAKTFLNAGVQFVAMNLQTTDKHLVEYLESFDGFRFKQFKR
jgi:hypothetical protein